MNKRDIDYSHTHEGIIEIDTQERWKIWYTVDIPTLEAQEYSARAELKLKRALRWFELKGRDAWEEVPVEKVPKEIFEQVENSYDIQEQLQLAYRKHERGYFYE